MISRIPALTIPLMLLFMLLHSACSNSAGIPGSSQKLSQGLAETRTKSANLVAFEGQVFVASTKPEKALWQSAGWQISRQSIAGTQNSVPKDCTLYRHQGVDDQWIGSCSGYTYIPSDGANHIAVIHTSPDGTTKMIQVAPPPIASDP